MTDHTYTVGENVFIVEYDKVSLRRAKVTAIKKYKRGPKITCGDGSEWDPERDRLWGHRSDPWYKGPKLTPHSDEMETVFATALTKKRLQWVLNHFKELTVEQYKDLGTVLDQIRQQYRPR